LSICFDGSFGCTNKFFKFGGFLKTILGGVSNKFFVLGEFLRIGKAVLIIPLNLWRPG